MKPDPSGVLVKPNRPYLGRHGGYAGHLDVPGQHVPAQARVLGVLQVADAAPDPVLVPHVGGPDLLVDMCPLVKEDNPSDLSTITFPLVRDGVVYSPDTSLQQLLDYY